MVTESTKMTLLHSNGMTFKFKVKYKWSSRNMVFSIKTARISETVSYTAKVTGTTNSKSYNFR